MHDVRTVGRTNFNPCRHQAGHHISHALGAGNTPYGRAPNYGHLGVTLLLSGRAEPSDAVADRRWLLRPPPFN